MNKSFSFWVLFSLALFVGSFIVEADAVEQKNMNGLACISKSAAMEIAWAYQEDGHRGANIATHVMREKGLCVITTSTMWWVEETENVFHGEDGFITLIQMSINEGMEPLIFGLKFTNASLV